MKKGILFRLYAIVFVSLVLFVLSHGVSLAVEEKCQECHGEPSFKVIVEGKENNLYINSDKYDEGIHKEVLCGNCHKNFEVIPHTDESIETFITEARQSCADCHEKANAQFVASAHGKAEAEGGKMATGCLICHPKMHEGIGAKEPEAPTSHREVAEETCGHCHEHDLETYLEGYHGKTLVVFGYNKSASCVQCHGAHTANPLHDKGEAIKACEQCHENANENFVNYGVHADENDRVKEPWLFYIKWAMTFLLCGTLAIFYTHSVLWAYRDIVTMRRKKKQDKKNMTNGGAAEAVAANSAVKKGAAGEKDEEVEYIRFNKFHRVMHWLMMLSFMVLVFTGMPLRFRNATWAQAMMNLFGGVGIAGIIHRVGAAITFIYFGSEVIYGIVYCFIIKRMPIFGPDSMVPRKKDLDDIIRNVRYFFGLGQKPEFDRFTYWEKFDYIAVFWGMVAIGATGLFLAFPTFFARLLPGKIFNIATIMHSDEAMLAAGFIFIVHWFNTHWRPGKMPLDPVIFTGRLTKQEMIEERQVEWKRVQENPELERRMRIKKK